MRKIEKFVAGDGKEFNDLDECIKWEDLNSKYISIMNKLPKRSEDSAFVNGKGYIQHTKEIFTVIEQFEKLAIEELRLKGFKDITGKEKFTSILFGRVMDDYDCASCKYLWRLLCINPISLREYGQPYYANHESEVEV